MCSIFYVKNLVAYKAVETEVKSCRDLDLY